MYEGTLDGSKVCIKRLRVYTKGGPRKATRVRYRRLRFLSFAFIDETHRPSAKRL